MVEIPPRYVFKKEGKSFVSEILNKPKVVDGKFGKAFEFCVFVDGEEQTLSLFTDDMRKLLKEFNLKDTDDLVNKRIRVFVEKIKNRKGEEKLKWSVTKA